MPGLKMVRKKREKDRERQRKTETDREKSRERQTDRDIERDGEDRVYLESMFRDRERERPKK